MTHTAFPHQHTAHCESGVMSTLLRYHGLDWDEPMVFGMAAALSFAYIPVVKLSGMPLIAYRTPPKTIIRRTCRQLDVQLTMQRFRSPSAGMAALDAALQAGKVVGLQTSVFWLPYFPSDLRFHFNAHNLLVYGKEGNEYLISDPVFEHVQRCAAADLQNARFAKGALAAKGLMYTLDHLPNIDQIHAKMPHMIRYAVRQTARQMRAPLFFVGTRGIHTLANKIAALAHARLSEQEKALYLGHIVRMQEEIGTGGAGFRYLYAYFLEQASDHLHDHTLAQAAQTLTNIGDEWRQFAVQCVRQCRKPQPHAYVAVADALHQLAEREAMLWHTLNQWAKGSA